MIKLFLLLMTSAILLDATSAETTDFEAGAHPSISPLKAPIIITMPIPGSTFIPSLDGKKGINLIVPPKTHQAPPELLFRQSIDSSIDALNRLCTSDLQQPFARTFASILGDKK